MSLLFSVVIPTFNGEKTIGRLLNKISDFGSNYSKEVIIIDSSSTDKTLKIVEKFKYKIKNLKILKIKKKDFNHGETRNLGVREARGKYICFFSQDALPQSREILKYSLEDFNLNQEIVAVYGKHIPYADTPMFQKIETLCHWEMLDRHVNRKGVLIKTLSDPFIPLTQDNKYWWYQLSNTSSCYKRSFLLEYPFAQTAYGEDMLIGRKIIEKGLSIVYDLRCSVFHSHSYNFWEYFQREKESLGLAVSKMRLKKKINIFCKIKLLLKMKTPILKKFIYLSEFIVYYFLKLIVFISLKLEKGRLKSNRYNQ